MSRQPQSLAAALQAPAKPVARRTSGGTIPTVAVNESLNKMSGALEAVLGSDPASFIRTVQTTWRYSDLKNKITDMDTLRGAVLQVAQLRLSLDPSLGQAYILPFKGKAQLVIGYKGLVHLAVRTGLVHSIEGRLVRANDKFEFTLGSEDRLEHSYDLGQDRGEIIGVYAVARLPSGQNAFREPMSYLEAQRHREYSPSWRGAEQLRIQKGKKNTSLWATDEPSMLRKTAVRQFCLKSLPLTNEFAAAIAADGRIRSFAENEPVQPIEEFAQSPYDWDVPEEDAYDDAR